MSIKRKIKRMIDYIRRKKIVSIPSVTRSESMMEGKTVLITGGSGGIGMAIAERMLTAGAKVIICGTKESKLKACTDSLNYPEQKLRYMVLDLKDVASFGSKIDEANQIFHTPINVLINSAGLVAKHTFLDTTEEEYDNVFDVNVKGTYFICQAYAKHLIANNLEGKILNLSSSSALRPAWGPYQMSKWAIKGFTIGLADLLLPHGIVVNAIAPGPTATTMLKAKDDDDLSLPTSPIGRYTTPSEIAELALILVSDLGNIVVGDTLYATGGSGVISLHR